MTPRSFPSHRRSRPVAILSGLLLAAAILLPTPVVLAGGAARSAVAGADGSRVAASLPAAVSAQESARVRLAIGRTERAEATAATAAFDPAKVNLHLTLVKGGLSKPVLVTHAGDGSGRRFVVEQTGRIKIITSAGALLATPFIDLRPLISTGSERGLLGLAFHPKFETNGYFYVNYTNPYGHTIINRYKAAPGANTASRGTALRIMTILQPYANHNGGHLAFGPDGFLYIGMGDGGGSGDPGNRAQNVNTLLGKMLRIDVDHWASGKHYRSPATNPYVGRTGLDEIWSRGLRNPWRWSFDMPTKKLFIADVGQNRYEEVNRSNPIGTTPAGRAANYGWRQLEGRACFNPPSGCSKTGKHPPLVVYGHTASGPDNCSVTGGYVYRGTASPVLRGGYLYGDFCSGRIWVIDSWAATPTTGRLVHGPGGSPSLLISSFGEDEAGELYVCDLAGRVYRISATSL